MEKKKSKKSCISVSFYTTMHSFAIQTLIQHVRYMNSHPLFCCEISSVCLGLTFVPICLLNLTKYGDILSFIHGTLTFSTAHRNKTAAKLAWSWHAYNSVVIMLQLKPSFPSQILGKLIELKYSSIQASKTCFIAYCVKWFISIWWLVYWWIAGRQKL